MAQSDDMLAIFEDLYRAKMRQSLFELEAVLSAVEVLPSTKSRSKLLVQETLRCFLGEAFTECEARLAELRARYVALPALPPVKREESEEMG